MADEAPSCWRRPRPDRHQPHHQPQAGQAGRFDDAWQALEEAHVLSQPWAWPHIRVHAAMLALRWRVRDAGEVRGQLLRLLVAGPGSVTGRYPAGNTGRASAPATQPMSIPAELVELLRSSS
jgi:hypothetical protein